MLRLLILAVLFPVFLLWVETLQQSPRFSQFFVNRSPVPQTHMKAIDDDVKAETLRVQGVDPQKQIIRVQGLRKVFGRGATPTHAVRGVSWATDEGTVFGLLGVNGAGKTTSFQMMSGILTPSEGEVHILGINVVEETARARRFIGYCPQIDALIETLTVHEHLTLYGRMKGLTGEVLAKAIDAKLDELQLRDFVFRRAGSLSGGNKRKLSVAMAVIGEPPVIFLDEPSTGMDPFARRFMWTAIKDIAEKRKQSAVVLTTHSMEEAEALCNTIAIQVDGQFRCLGSAQHLKSRFGHGYEVSVKFAPAPIEAIQQVCAQWGVQKQEFVSQDVLQNNNDPAKFSCAAAQGGPLNGVTEVTAESLAGWGLIYDRAGAMLDFLLALGIGDVTLQEHHGLAARWKVGCTEDQVATILTRMTDSKQTLGITDFEVVQASLEQIFNTFALEAGGVVS